VGSRGQAASWAGVTRAVEIEPGQIRVIDVGPLKPGPGEARIAVRACGICGTDQHLLHGMALPPGTTYPVRPGHEVAGTVIEVNESHGEGQLRPGDEVVLHPLDPCGACPSCTTGEEQHCTSARVLGISAPGGMADELIWPTRRLVAATGLPPLQAALLPDAVATAWHALRLAELPAGGTLLVIGAGGVGTHVLELARHALPGVRLGAVARSEGTVARLERLGLDFVHQGLDGLRKAFRAALGEADAVVDFSGSVDGPRQAVRVLRSGGRLVLGSILDEPADVGTVTGLVTRGIHVIGSYASSLDDLRTVTDMARSGGIDLAPSVSEVVELSEAPRAFELLEQRPPGLVRVVVTP